LEDAVAVCGVRLAQNGERQAGVEERGFRKGHPPSTFAVFPLVAFTSDKLKMGGFVNGSILRFTSYCVAFVIAGINLWLLLEIFRGKS